MPLTQQEDTMYSYESFAGAMQAAGGYALQNEQSYDVWRIDYGPEVPDHSEYIVALESESASVDDEAKYLVTVTP